MSDYYLIDCPCGHKNNIIENVCSACGRSLPGPINVRRASLPVEIEALDKRYADARQFLSANDMQTEGDYFGQLVTNQGRAIINTNFNFVWDWLVRNKFSYQSYRRQVMNGSRMRAKFENDVTRSIADSILFGSAIDVIYGALTVNDEGMNSYGDISIVLKTSSIETRTSSLEVNSYHFIDDISAQGWIWKNPVPAGYMAIWPDNYKIAVAKVHKSLKKGLKDNDLAKLVLNSSGNRDTDHFIELYIYGKIVASAIDKIRIPTAFINGLGSKARSRLKVLEGKFNVEHY
jgi:hypothetical protein